MTSETQVGEVRHVGDARSLPLFVEVIDEQEDAPWRRTPPNLPLLRKVLDIIDNDPEHWDQCTFETDWTFGRRIAPKGKCGTTRCIAGWVDHLTLGKVTHGDVHAQQELGLTNEETFALFYGTAIAPERQRAAIQKVCERIAARGGERL
jgi:hypothetical protein